jgi:hypothetical protein
MVTPEGKNAPAPWVPWTRAGCNVGAVSIANMELENVSGDVNTAFGPNSPEAQEAKSTPNKAIADFEGIAIHCAAGNPVCSHFMPQVASQGTKVRLASAFATLQDGRNLPRRLATYNVRESKGLRAVRRPQQSPALIRSSMPPTRSCLAARSGKCRNHLKNIGGNNNSGCLQWETIQQALILYLML